MLELVCMNVLHYQHVINFIEEHELEKEADIVFAEEYENKICKDLDDVIDKYGLEVVDAIAPAFLKKLYPEDYWKRTMACIEDDYEEFFTVYVYRLDSTNKEDAVKFISGLAKEHSIDTVDLLENGIENLK